MAAEPPDKKTEHPSNDRPQKIEEASIDQGVGLGEKATASSQLPEDARPRPVEGTINQTLSSLEIKASGTHTPPPVQQKQVSDQKFTDVSGANLEGAQATDNVELNVEIGSPGVQKTPTPKAIRDVELRLDDSGRPVRINEEIIPVLKPAKDDIPQEARIPNFSLLPADPGEFDFRNKISVGQIIHWPSVDGVDDLTDGDTVLFWLRGENGGVYGWGRVIAEPAEIASGTDIKITVRNTFLFPLPDLLVKNIVGSGYPFPASNSNALLPIDEQTFYHLLDVAGLYGNSMPVGSAYNFDYALADDVVKNNPWLFDLSETARDLGYTVFSTARWVYFRLPGIPPMAPDTNDDFQHGITLFAVDNSGISFAGIAYQFKLLGLEEIANQYLTGLQQFFPDSKIEEEPLSGDRVLVQSDGSTIQLEGPNFDWKGLLQFASDLELRIRNDYELIISRSNQWQNDPDTLKINAFSSSVGSSVHLQEVLQFARFALTDRWTTEDLLGYKDYAVAATTFLNDPRTEAPLAISIQAPWGGGKTSLMKMIQKELDPKYEERKVRDSEAHISFRRVRSSIRDLGQRGKQSEAPKFTDNEWISIWFNPWKYEDSEQIWAGLADTVIKDVANRRSTLEREKFYLDLNLRRIDTQALRLDIHKALITGVLLWCSVGLAAGLSLFGGLLLTLPDLFPTGKLLETLGIGAFGSSVLGSIAGYFSTQGKAAAVTLPEYIRVPNYSEKLGFRHAAEEDIKRVFQSQVSEDGTPAKFVIFIDDLDRCSPDKVAHVFEAINHFVADRELRCYVMMGMDGEIVAAALEKHYEDLFDHIPIHSRSHSIGWYYLDKFVQIPFVIPTPDKDKLKDLARRVAEKKEPMTKTDQSNYEDIRPFAEGSSRFFDAYIKLGSWFLPLGARARISDLRERVVFRSSTNNSEDSEIQHENPSPIEKVVDDQEDQKQKLAERAEELTDDAIFEKIWELRKWDFNHNPRTIKRCLNLARFFYLIHSIKSDEGADIPDEDALIRWTYFAFRWPDAARWIQTGKDMGSTTSSRMEKDPEWSASKIRIQDLYLGTTSEWLKDSVWKGDDEFALKTREIYPWLEDQELFEYCQSEFGHLLEHADKGFW